MPFPRPISGSFGARRTQGVCGRPRPISFVAPRPGARGAPMRPSTFGPPTPPASRSPAMPETLILFQERIDTPIGELLIVADREGRLRAIDWSDHEDRLWRLLRLHYGAAGHALHPARRPAPGAMALEAYFAGDPGAIDNVEVATAGTPFQR